MSRPRGTLFTSSNFEPIVKAPLDARQKVQTYGDLTNPATWEDFNGNVWLYKGTLVIVTEDPSSGLYWLNDPDNYTLTTSWSQVIAAPVVDVSVGVINVGDGSAGVYAVTDASGFIHLRTISGKGQAVVYEDGDQIIVDVSVSGGGGSGNYDTTLDPSLTMDGTVGGYPAGTTVSELSGDSLITMWDNLLFPTANPDLTAPSGSFTMGPTTTLYEVGSNATLTFTTTLNRGSINPQYTADSPYRSGLPNNFIFSGTGLIDASSSAIPYIHPAIDVSIVQGNQSWSAQIGYDGGVQPYDNKGNPYDSSLAAGSLSASPTRTIEGVYPIFATTVNITTLTKQLPLVSMSTSPAPSSSGMALVTETGGNKQKIDIPDKWTAINPLTAIQQYNTVSSTWETISLATWTTSATTQTIQGVIENYTRYTYNGVDRSSVQIRLIF